MAGNIGNNEMHWGNEEPEYLRQLNEAADLAEAEEAEDQRLSAAAEEIEALDAAANTTTMSAPDNNDGERNNGDGEDGNDGYAENNNGGDDGDNIEVGLAIRLLQTMTRKSRKFEFLQTAYRVVFDVDENSDQEIRIRLDVLVTRFFQNLIDTVGRQAISIAHGTRHRGAAASTTAPVRTVSGSDYVRFCFVHPALTTPINLPFSRYDQITAQRLTEAISKQMQSHTDFCIDTELQIHVQIQPQFAGGRRNQHVQFNSIEQKIAAKRCVVQIKNQDNICMARALVVSKAKADDDPAYNEMRKPESEQRQHRHTQRNRALQLCRDAGVSVGGQHDLTDMAKFQAHLRNYRLIAVEATSDRIIFDGGFERASTSMILGLLHHNGHYHALTNVGAWFEGKFFCYGCCKRYEKIGQHRCGVTCYRCLGAAHNNLQVSALPMRCDECQLTFLTAECYERHLTIPTAYNATKGKMKQKRNSHAQGKTVCEMKKTCKLCNQYYNGYDYYVYGKKHECGKHRCSNCKKMEEMETHLCFMQLRALGTPENIADTNSDYEEEQEQELAESTVEQPCTSAEAAKRARTEGVTAIVKAKKPRGPHKFIFWDTECQQDNENAIHKANLFVAQVTCDVCIGLLGDAYRQCKMHGNTIPDFWCKSTAEFGRFFLAQQNATFVAHNFKGYDSQFVLDFCRSNGVTPEVIMNGNKCTYLYLPVQKVRFVDSLNFLPMALAKFPETFAFEEMRKGHFPHFFNTEANANYEGPLPEKCMYGYAFMKPEQRNEFDKWYEGELVKGSRFNMAVDLQSYCENDVSVLRTGSTKFRQLLLKIGGTDPFKEAITIASCAQLIYRKLFLKPNYIAVVPPSGYRPLANQSKKALQWLSWLAHSQNLEIRDARHPEGEFHVGGYQVDGYCVATNTVYEFLGSYWHGDPNAFDYTTFNRRTNCPMGILHEKTMRRQQDIELAGFNYVSIWESEWDTQVKRDLELRDFIDSSPGITGPLDPRDAFFGGRTNASRLYYKQPNDGSSKVYYVDFCSLYPAVNKYCEYPVGHPEIIVDPPNGIESYFGLAKCKVIPPRNLFHPVLPYRHPDGKLMFPLCTRCADAYQITSCRHTDQQRQWIGTWSTMELQHAIARGYSIVKIFEVWHFPNSTKYSSDEPGSGLFADYVNTFIKVKQEASGLPPNITTDEQIDTYINEFYKREGVRLEKDKIVLNPGLRYTAKLFLNSLWGKFGQRSTLPRTEFLRTVTNLNTMLQRRDIEISELLDFEGPTIDDDICQVQYKLKTDFADELPSANVFIAVCTTAHARLKLLCEMEKLDRRVLYYDTDSIIYESRPGDEEPPTGSFLGELTHELKPDDYIVEFFSGGPKNYGYRTKSGKTIQKHKGITLTASVLQKLTFDAAKQMILEHSTAEVINIDLQQIRRDKGATALKTVNLRKKYQFHYDKRVITDDFYTLPYGHEDIS